MTSIFSNIGKVTPYDVEQNSAISSAVPGPLAREEDAVYQFVTMVARGYQGERVWTTGLPEPVA